MKKSKSDYVIQTVANSLRLLEAFRNEDELGVTELSRMLDLHKNNVFRLLATLEQKGYVEQIERNERYRLGVRCLELGQSFSGSGSLLRPARPLLESLSRDLDETIHLAVLRDFEVIHLDGEQSERMITSGLRIGARLPVHATALGKVLLGCADAATRETYDRQVLSLGELEERTPETITDRDKLLEHFHAVGASGHALDLEECETGLYCLAVPVYDASGWPVAAISVSVPAFRMDREQLLSEYLPTLANAGVRLSGHLGFSA